MLKFISFGSGSSGNCYLLYTESDGLLIDAGVGVRTLKRFLKDRGLSFSNIHNILITHDHADHIKSVGSLSRDYGLPVFATHRVHAGIERNYCVRHKITSDCVKVIEKGTPFRLGDFEIYPFEVPHDSSDNVGYQIRYGHTVFCVMTDIGHVTDVMKGMIASAHYLIIEANHDREMLMEGPYPQYLKERVVGPVGHLCNEDCAKAIAENVTERLKHIWLCHLSQENNHPELARKTIEQLLRNYGIIAGKDFALDVLKRKLPSETYLLDE